MKILKSLGCCNITLTIGDLLMSEGFPRIEELDISCYRYGINNATSPVSDIDIKALSLALTKLRKVKLSGNHVINYSLFFHLCKNCEFLENVALTCCEIISQDGIASAIITRYPI
ncbi:putative leucine-rich repeat domain, L domain-containing protein [Lupinus albus]|uniref:Putative leucine-rich repeat domain, L domain-containing protein n=1 Tax=Lupinus albus TaxID=3870 RepID=A0A6A4MX12_LUPAL|nr:putative leucine-rich repeat domain, L domain-containing protein [Lupinus albus]